LLDVGIAASGNRPGVRGFSGSLRSDRSGGRLEIETSNLVVTAPGILGKPLGFDTTSGTVIWRRSNNRTTLLSDSIVLKNDFFENETSVEVSYVDGDAAPVVDIESNFSISDISAAKIYVPYMAKRPRMSQWFQEGLVSGHIPRGKARLYGPLDKFPFDEGEGLFLIEGDIRDAVLIYQPKWPAAKIINAGLIVENMRLYSGHNRVITAGNEIVDGKIEIANFREPIFTLSATANGTLESLRDLAINSPINEMLGGQLDNVTVSGAASASLDLSVPIRDWESFEFTTKLQTSNGSFEFAGFDAPLTELSGVVTIEREKVSSESLTGNLLGRPVSIELMPAPESMPDYRVIATATGAVTAEALGEELGLPLGERISGEAAYTARLLFPRGKVDEPPPFTVEIASDLIGLAIDYPKPLGKRAEDGIDFAGDIYLPRGGKRIESRGRAGDLLSWQIDFAKDQVWDLDSGLIVFGTEPAGTAAPDTRGLHLRGNADSVHAQDWFDLARNAETKVGMAERIRSIDMSIKDLHLIGQHLVDHRVRMDRSAQDWLVQLDGENIIGSAFVPYDFNSGRSIVIEAERLILPGDDEDADRAPTQIEPRSLPGITLKVGELALGDRHLGAVEATFERTADGLESNAIIARDATFEIVANGSWVIDESDPAGHRSQITATLTSTNVKATMERLGYDPGIVGDELSMLLDLSWSGGPNEDLMESLDGEVTVKIGSGRLEDVKPGAGRVFGLMSVAALPRRLALDFRDVFGKGFAFDEISSTFVLVDGNAYTCNLSLEGPAASIGIVGRAGLVARDYEQVAVVSANFGNALPVAGALVAGPQVAAVLLIISQIFKKPLQEVSQVYYDISGTFDEPVVETTTAEIFGLSAEKSGCVSEAE
ncbi:MAG: TIGR02099 family protein, partial [Desulfobulbaceae bacterium]|nr:TIGR02099 family protein [Desulfobulbaceae bacterium]